MSETLNEVVRRLNADLAVADTEVAAWPKSSRAYRRRGALLTDLARAAEAVGTEATAVAVAARIAADADAARAAELTVVARRHRSYVETLTAIKASAAEVNPGTTTPA